MLFRKVDFVSVENNQEKTSEEETFKKSTKTVCALEAASSSTCSSYILHFEEMRSVSALSTGHGWQALLIKFDFALNAPFGKFMANAR